MLNELSNYGGFTPLENYPKTTYYIRLANTRKGYELLVFGFLYGFSNGVHRFFDAPVLCVNKLTIQVAIRLKRKPGISS